METSFYWQSCAFGKGDKLNLKILTQKGPPQKPSEHRSHSKAVTAATPGTPHSINAGIFYLHTTKRCWRNPRQEMRQHLSKPSPAQRFRYNFSG